MPFALTDVQADALNGGENIVVDLVHTYFDINPVGFLQPRRRVGTVQSLSSCRVPSNPQPLAAVIDCEPTDHGRRHRIVGQPLGQLSRQVVLLEARRTQGDTTGDFSGFLGHRDKDLRNPPTRIVRGLATYMPVEGGLSAGKGGAVMMQAEWLNQEWRFIHLSVRGNDGRLASVRHLAQVGRATPRGKRPCHAGSTIPSPASMTRSAAATA